MFDSSYRGRQSRYSTYFTAIDSTPTRLQGDQKSLVYGWKCPHYRRSNLGDRSIYDTCRVRDHVWLPIYRNPDVRTSIFCSSPQNFLHPSDVWKITKIDSSEVRHFWGQSVGKNQNRGVALTFWARFISPVRPPWHVPGCRLAIAGPAVCQAHRLDESDHAECGRVFFRLCRSYFCNWRARVFSPAIWNFCPWGNSTETLKSHNSETGRPNVPKFWHNVEPVDPRRHVESRDRATSGFDARWRQRFFFDPQFLENDWAWHEMTGTKGWGTMPPTNLPSVVRIFRIVWGSGPPNEIFENFDLIFFSELNFPQNLHIDGGSYALSTQKNWGKSSVDFLRNGGSKILGRRPLFEFDPLGGPDRRSDSWAL